MFIVGISGKARHGKDTAALQLMNRHGFARMAFADALKDGAKVMFSLSDEQVNGALKETIDERYGKTPRQILQWLGTDYGRQMIHPDVWIIALKAKIDAIKAKPLAIIPLGIVIPDVRFPNEADAVKAWGGFMWRVQRPGVEAVNAHVSETALDEYAFDWYLRNLGTVDHLLELVDEAFEALRGSCLTP